MAESETLKVGDVVETLIALPGLPGGAVGRVKEVGHLFLAVEFEEGRVGYYSPRQLRKCEPETSTEVPETW